jgi:uncharacterized protein YijF (DUF1287 family)
MSAAIAGRTGRMKLSCPRSLLTAAALVAALSGCSPAPLSLAPILPTRLSAAPARLTAPARAEQAIVPPAAAAPPPDPPAVPPETSLGVADHGIFPDLDGRVQLELPPEATPDQVTATVDDDRRILVVYVSGWPVKVYPLGGPLELRVGAEDLALRPGDRGELAPLLRAGSVRHLAPGEAPAPGDRDGDGIPDPLDLLIGGKKTVANADRYVESYVRIPYPNGDIPRDIGVCTDVIVRAARNFGLDLQSALHQDILGARAAYPLVTEPDSSIDHRRVQALLPYFKRHFQEHTPRHDDPSDPLRPGDIVLLDTFPSRYGPDHIGIISDRRDARGVPLVINNWTDGTVTSEMALLPAIPITHRFRVRPASGVATNGSVGAQPLTGPRPAGSVRHGEVLEIGPRRVGVAHVRVEPDHHHPHRAVRDDAVHAVVLDARGHVVRRDLRRIDDREA